MAYYKWYDSPDYEDWLKKTFYLVKPATTAGLTLATVDIMECSYPAGWIPIADRFFRIMTRPIIFAITFSTASYIFANFRKKEDGWNHVAGGLACFPYLNHIIQWWPCSLFIGAIGLHFLYMARDLKKRFNTEFFSDIYDYHLYQGHSPFEVYNTWSWIKQYPKTWVRAEDLKDEES